MQFKFHLLDVIYISEHSQPQLQQNAAQLVLPRLFFSYGKQRTLQQYRPAMAGGSLVDKLRHIYSRYVEVSR